MGRRETDNANRAAEQLDEANQKSYQAIADTAVGLQERNIEFFQGVLESWNETLREQAETNRTMTETLVGYAYRQQEALRILAHDSVDLYMDGLDAMLSYFQEGMEPAKEAATKK